MSTTVAAPPDSYEVGGTVPRRRRRWPMVLAVVLTVTLISGLAAWQAIARNYQPLRNGGLFGAGGAPSHGRSLIYKDGARFRVRFNVINRGRWPVEITGVRFHALEESPARQVAVEMSTPFSHCCRLMPFEPFRLGPREARLMVVRLRFVGCGIVGRNDRYGLGDPTMTFRFLGFERTITLGLTGRVWITGPPIGCPR